jgi:hypothetical protein
MEYGYSLWTYIEKFEERTAPRVLAQDVHVTLGQALTLCSTNSLEVEMGRGRDRIRPYEPMGARHDGVP